MVLRCKHCS